jgi:phosphinothricin acetyltransferase
MHIRDATEADLPAIVEIYNESIPGQWSTADTKPVRVEDRLEWFRCHDAARRPLWVLEVDDTVVAWVSLEWFYQGRPAYDATAEISLYVASRHRRKGYGSFLKKRMIERCPELGVRNVISMHFDHNDATRRLNDKLGFKEMGHLSEIAEIGGAWRGLVLSVLRVSPSAKLK